MGVALLEQWSCEFMIVFVGDRVVNTTSGSLSIPFIESLPDPIQTTGCILYTRSGSLYLFANSNTGDFSNLCT